MSVPIDYLAYMIIGTIAVFENVNFALLIRYIWLSF